MARQTGSESGQVLPKPTDRTFKTLIRPESSTDVSTGSTESYKRLSHQTVQYGITRSTRGRSSSAGLGNPPPRSSSYRFEPRSPISFAPKNDTRFSSAHSWGHSGNTTALEPVQTTPSNESVYPSRTVTEKRRNHHGEALKRKVDPCTDAIHSNRILGTGGLDRFRTG